MGGPVEGGTVVYALKPTLALSGVVLWGGEVAFSGGSPDREGCSPVGGLPALTQARLSQGPSA